MSCGQSGSPSTHICVTLEKICWIAGAHLVTLQPNDSLTNVHIWVKWTLGNNDITPGKKGGAKFNFTQLRAHSVVGADDCISID